MTFKFKCLKYSSFNIEEVRAYRREFEESRKKGAESTNVKESADLMQDVAVMVGKIVDGRLAALQLPAAPPCRPPLAGDSRPLRKRGCASRFGEATRPPPSIDQRKGEGHKERQGEGKGKGKGKAKEVEWTAFGPSTSKEAAPQGKDEEGAKPMEEPAARWTEVVRRKTAAKKQTASAPPAKNPVIKNTVASTLPTMKEAPKPKLALPRSAAVIIKLRPEAVARGATYGSILLKAESSIDIKDLGIGPLRIRQSATGARLIEVPGSTSGEKADALATRLKEALDEEAEVLRPEKKAEMRISGLSDAVTAERLATTVAKEVGCSPGQVHVRNIRVGQMGSGTAHIELPAVAGKKLLQAGSIAVGWSRGVVHLMQARPRHCFRCLGLGHVGVACTAGTDRSTLCYRCGQAGHKAAGCSATARCAVCADAGRPAGHVMGGMACKPPITRGKFPPQTSQEGNRVVSADAEMTE
ncbi:zinc finger CCHC domain-containing protein 3-like [Melitaea cinxia]|uniref:zinc finger CCHC domain-containing protein 3-like n=1 Tax=Melitaea cinxia TaxID=113334 RepID=UPI001E27495C|nr:zinc finger CCHC domain-containing protein 3-like [Melitaea cinxia]